MAKKYSGPSCVYLTIYRGNLLPPFYIGSSYVQRIERDGYRGTVKSKPYRKIWNEELKNHPELFGTKIIQTFPFRKEALEREREIHLALHIHKNSLYINQATANGIFGLPQRWTEEEKRIHSEKLKLIWSDPGLKKQVSKRFKKLWKDPEFRKARIEEVKTLHREGKINHRRGKDHPNWGKHHTKTTREKQRRAKLGKYDGKNNPMYGRSHGEKAKKALSDAAKGLRWVHFNPGNYKKIPLEELEDHLFRGWKRGRGPIS